MMKKYLIIVISFGLVHSQFTPVSAKLKFSSPMANMSFLSLNYVNPASTSTVLGGFINPASYGRISHLEFDLGMGFTNTSTMNTRITLLDSTEYNNSVIMPIDIGVKDNGGIYGFGIGTKLSLLGFGFGVLKPFEFAVGLNGNTVQPFSVNQTLTDTIFITNRDSMNKVVPVEMHWDMNINSRTDINGVGDLSLRARPIFLGTGVGFGPFAFGIGFKITKYTGDGAPFIYAKSTIVTSVEGSSPQYRGNINLQAYFSDTIVKITMINNYNGLRKAISIGTNVSLGILKIGAYYEQGFETTISGSYTYECETADLNSIQIEDLDTPYIYIQNDSLHQDTVINADLTVANFDTSKSTAGGVTLPGYKAVGIGVDLGLLNAYAGGTIPEKGELNFAYMGLFLKAPVPHFKVRTGINLSTRYFYSNKGKVIPMSVLPYAGVGVSIPLNLGSIPFGPTLGLPVVLDFSLKSNLLSLTGKMLEKMINDSTFDVTGAPNPFKTLSLGVGIRIKM